MKKEILSALLLSGLMVLTTSCANSQSRDSASTNNDKLQPKIDIKVNKKYDDKGNVIGYDSTYSYFYSDTTSSPMNDSLFYRFHNFPNGKFPGFSINPFNIDSLFNQNLLGNQGFMNNPFMNDPFFNNNFNLNVNPFDEMNRMLQRMDSLQNHQRFINPPPQPKNKEIHPQPQKPKPLPEKIDTIGVKIKVI